MAAPLIWKKRRAITITCPSGVECDVRRPGPEIGLKGGKMMRVLYKITDADGKPLPFDQVLKRIEALSDEELASLMIFAREVVMATVVRPKLVAKPSPGIEDEIGPDDIELSDFWHIFNWAMSGAPGVPVQTKDGETTVDAVETFSGKQTAGDSAGQDGGAQQEESSGADGNPGPGNRAGVRPGSRHGSRRRTR